MTSPAIARPERFPLPARLRRLLLVVNPHASSADEVAEMARTAFADCAVEVILVRTESADDLEHAVEQHAESVDALILIGGDGTLHHALPVLHRHDLPIGLLPGGTANDFARCLRTPESVRATCEGLLQGREVSADLGIVNGVPFLNVSHVGPGAEVATRSSGTGKRLLGVVSYLRHALDVILNRRRFAVEVDCDGERHVLRSIQVSVGNAPYFGGGNLIYAESAINDHQLYLYSVRPLKWWHLLLVAPLLRRGRGDSTHGIDRLHGRRITIRTSKPLPLSADGEAIGTTPAEFTVIPNALRFLMPNHDAESHPHVMLDDRQVALQDVIAALHEAADYYHEAAQRLEDETLRPLFEALAERRRRGAERLGEHVKDLGALPRQPDPDRETLEHLAEWLRAQLSTDRRRTLIQGSIERAHEIEALLDKTEACELPTATHARVARERQRIEEDIARLKAAMPAPAP